MPGDSIPACIQRAKQIAHEVFAACAPEVIDQGRSPEPSPPQDQQADSHDLPALERHSHQTKQCGEAGLQHVGAAKLPEDGE